MFVTRADFVNKPYSIPFAQETSPTNSFDVYLDRCEKELLKGILGYALYKEFIAGLAVDPIAAIWTALRDGADYTDTKDKLNEYRGLKSILIPYIYHHWTTIGIREFTGLGFVIPKSENSVSSSPAREVAGAYNEASDLIGCKNVRNSLYGFLTCPANISSYALLEFKGIGNINMFGL
jgi:hypothetical protein